ncbi:hypothetical protein T459_17214 [Capsicum annuum]|uniref:TIR domain-containing protein n=1 Tax=Capsicum annuum TaxID=4072 RepID=A0A2G2ZAY5_CAPAN|nr:hypothetical protein T459_17214 [Capsicum annuum]
MASQIQSVKKWKYDVFLNFRQEDLDGYFVTYLYKHLEDIGINVFTPDFEYERVTTEISEAIEESRFGITIFSRDYASSRRCLEELNTVQVSGIIDHVLDKHTVCLKASELEMTQRWKNALCKAFEIAGSEKDYVKMW